MFHSTMKDEKRPVRMSSFWGIRCESGKKYRHIVNQKYHISMAALDPTSVKSGNDAVSLFVERDGSEFLLCNLQKDSVLQVNLNLFFDKGKMVFFLKGQGIVHLTGYLIEDDNYQRISSPSPTRNNALPNKKHASVPPSQKTSQKKLFGTLKQKCEDSSKEEEEDYDNSYVDEEVSDDNEGTKQLLQFAKKRPISSLDELDDDDEVYHIDLSDEELPPKKLPIRERQSAKKLKDETSTRLAGKKATLKKVTKIIELDDDSNNGDMNSSIGRTPMQKKKLEVILQKSALNDFKKVQHSIVEDSPNSVSAFNNIAKVLAKIDCRLLDIERIQQEILEKLTPENSTKFVELPPELKLPCNSVKDVEYLEEWLVEEDNIKTLMVNFRLLGGQTIPKTVKRILEKLFSNQVCVAYNWTGKNNKIALRGLRITKIIPGIVRSNKNTSCATDEEIYSVLISWFRFSKDRDGGRRLRGKDVI